MSFKLKGYKIVKKAIDPKVAIFIYKYFLLKKKVSKTLLDTFHITPYDTKWGTWNDSQVENTYSIYGDIVMDTLLTEVKSVMEKYTHLKLIETYSYARMYKKGDILERHKDRFSCEISTTLNLGGDFWPIFINPNPKEGITKENKYTASKSKGICVNLKPGDMLIYKGRILEHWRDTFKGENCGQVFLHYNNLKTKGALKNKYDGRPHLGLPDDYKR
tara:strand:- start:195 stop:845 length:651 start_codon:yes stop_codon:yes gene_type:complete